VSGNATGGSGRVQEALRGAGRPYSHPVTVSAAKPAAPAPSPEERAAIDKASRSEAPRSSHAFDDAIADYADQNQGDYEAMLAAAKDVGSRSSSVSSAHDHHAPGEHESEDRGDAPSVHWIRHR
jgi:hypothetical protein